MIITDVTSLREVCLDAVSLEEEMDIVNKLEHELSASNAMGANGIGLAAPQIGIKKRVAIIRIGESSKINLVNAKIIFRVGNVASEEGCLSVPGKTVEVARSLDILIENCGFVSAGKFSAFGLPSICIQHEMDHWDGVLMTDKAIMRHTETGPNMLCPCGSKMKYKKCCGTKGNKK